MKKAVSAALGLLLAASPVCFGASAVDVNTYEPTLYFRASADENITVQPSGRVFVNIKKHPEGVNVNSGVYYLDEAKATNMVFVKWQSNGDIISLANNTDPITAAGACPYSRWKTAKSINISEHENIFSVSYASTSASPLALTGDSSDSYPLACFDTVIPGDAPAGLYEVSFITDNSGNRCNASYGEPLRDIRPSGDHAKSLYIAVSDRDLGDVNGSGKLEAVDASKILIVAANLAESGETGLSAGEELAADFNGDGKITATDASAVLVTVADLS
ncbi:MAG: hypothetical protein IKO47_05110 [Ruminococcus sp.]|nr:hypothetical protein [Ruminococcus sp.]